MTYAEFERAFAELVAAFPQREISTATQLAYWDRLQDIDARIFAAAAGRCIDRLEWFPSISQLRTAAEDIVIESIPDPYDAMKLFPHRVKNPMIRAILTSNLGGDDDFTRALRPENERSFGIIGDPRGNEPGSSAA